MDSSVVLLLLPAALYFVVRAVMWWVHRPAWSPPCYGRPRPWDRPCVKLPPRDWAQAAQRATDDFFLLWP
jgi:hypothetical protein